MIIAFGYRYDFSDVAWFCICSVPNFNKTDAKVVEVGFDAQTQKLSFQFATAAMTRLDLESSLAQASAGMIRILALALKSMDARWSRTKTMI